MNPSPAHVDAAAVALSPEVLRALAELHDLQFEAAAAWPLWPLLFISATIGLAALLVLRWWWQPRQRYLRRLRRLEKSYRVARAGWSDEAAGAPQLVAAISALLREVAIGLRQAPAMPAGLAGDDWLRWLDECAPVADRGAFMSGVGQDLLRWPFVRPAASPRRDVYDPARADALLALTTRWLRANA